MCDILVTERQMPPFRIFSTITVPLGNTIARLRHRLIASGHLRTVPPMSKNAMLGSTINCLRFVTQESGYLKFHQSLANVSPQRPGLRLSRSAILGERDNSNRIKTIRKKRPYPFCNQNDARYPRGGGVLTVPKFLIFSGLAPYHQCCHRRRRRALKSLL
jgi:hypothetical protein